MGLPSDLTSQHAKLDANISMMRGHLESVRPDSPGAREAFAQLQPWTQQIGEMLRGYLDAEQSGLLKQASRILGDSLEEISEINDHNDELIHRFELFVGTLDELGVDFGSEESMDQLRERFQEFVSCFERHRDAERNFYTLYSTILFPSGAATD
ncbi:MAG: hypothetical protein ACLFVJ_10770 [Persicimonas sp.]